MSSMKLRRRSYKDYRDDQDIDKDVPSVEPEFPTRGVHQVSIFGGERLIWALE